MAIPLTDLTDLRASTQSWRLAGERIVLVPTMGALHAGHLSLIDHARSIGQRVVVSIFVNPTQFGPNEDFSNYPRTVETDIAKLNDSEVDAVWLPSVELMYPSGHATSISVTGLADTLCGPFRPGHFSGVATVVTKLLNQVQPNVALFGEKDFQQLQVIRRVVADLDMPILIEGRPTMREPDGLALSSRNQYLTAEERETAPRLHKTLQDIGGEIRAGKTVEAALADGRQRLDRHGFSPVQYLSLCDAETLRETEDTSRPARILVAAYLGRTRLIDNIAL